MEETLKNTSLSIIGVPLYYGADRKGVDLGPDAIRGAHLHERLNALGYTIEDLGDLQVDPTLQPPQHGEKMKYLDEIVRVNKDLCNTVSAEMGKGRFPLVLGGDHSIAIGTIKGVLQHVKRLGVIWFDAHSDVNTDATTASGNIHGMSLAAVLGFGHPDLTSIGGADVKLNPENVVIIGARSIDPGERAFLKAKGIKVFTMHDIDKIGMKRVMEEALDIVSNGTDGVHLSLDLDGMDPWDAPGVGTPVYGGMSYRESHFAMELLFERNLLVSAEFVEVNPMLDQHNKTAMAAVALIGSTFGERIL